VTALGDPIVPRSRMTREGRRACLLGVGRALFAERGYHGASTADIAREAQCSEAVLYQHFASKLALFLAVLEEQAAGMQRRLEEAAKGGGDDPFGSIARALGQRVTEPHVPDSLKLRSLAVTMADEPEVRATLDRIRDGFAEIVGAAVRRSQASGRLRDDVDPEHVMALFAGLSFLGAFTCATEGDRALRRLGPIAETLVRILEPSDPSDPPTSEEAQ
jgi:AcrR family transcriptional regulator